MKRFLILSIFTGLLLAGCKKDYDKSVFEQTPEERSNALTEEYKSVLTKAPYGWMAYVYPQAGAAATFYFSFDTTNRVTQYCDMAASTITTSSESSYRIQVMQRTALVFDTYSYLHLLSDPDPNTAGGQSGQGYSSDFEYYFDKVTEDTIWLTGASKGVQMKMVRATLPQSQDFANGKLLATKTAMEQFLGSYTFLALKMQGTGNVTLNLGGARTLYMQYKGDDGALKTSSTAYSFTSTGIHLRDPLVYKDYRTQDIYWDKINDAVYVLFPDGSRGNSSLTLLPTFTPSANFGVLLSGVFLPGAAIPEASSTSFMANYKQVTDTFRFKLNGSLGQTRLLFDMKNKKMTILVYVQNGAGTYMGNFYYDFVQKGDGNFKFTYTGADANGQIFKYAMQPWLTNIEAYNFTFDYYRAANKQMIMQLKSVENTTYYFAAAPL